VLGEWTPLAASVEGTTLSAFGVSAAAAATAATESREVHAPPLGTGATAALAVGQAVAVVVSTVVASARVRVVGAVTAATVLRLMPWAVSPLTGGFFHISPTSGPASRGTGGGVSPPPLMPRGKPRPVTPCQRAPGGPLRGAIRRGADRFTEQGKPRVSPIRRSPPAVTGGFGSPGGTHVGGTTPSGAIGFSPRPEMFVCHTLGPSVRVPHPRVGRPYLPPVPRLSRRDGVFCGSGRCGRHGCR